ncbi:MAG: Uncharacterized protein G01um101416_667 [Microgenomates group bacterium Gr01-1014_16]|nr:MAG: Uncharacterized protein G01um101416_667 [Microgenomates group bacterium Gr01-1014_16]
MAEPKKIHFMGIGGSGMSAVAQIAHAQDYEVSGCDLNTDTPYIDKIKKLDIPVFSGHSEKHLENIDILAVTPAVFYQNNSHPEPVEGSRKKIIMTWQEFMGNYLHKDKYLICVAGTHGKSTTTTLAGLLLEAAGLNPTVEVGATVPAWHSNVRIGISKYFISEADEFHDNFSTYKADVIILNNIEMDHPEYFHTIDRLLESFQKFIDNLKPGGTLIYNSDSPLIHKLKLPIKSIPYTLSEFNYELSVPGNHNKSNALGVIKLAQLLQLDQSIVSKTLKSFSGIDRRIQLLGEKNGIKVYDDYANHPTAFAASISGVKELNPSSKIWAIIEPHTFSRLRAVLSDLPMSVSQADHIIISKIFASRETDPGDFTGADIASIAKARYIPEFANIISTLEVETRSGDVVLVMGSGDSYKLSRQILENL